MTARLRRRSTTAPSSSAPHDPATTSAISSSPISNGVTVSARVASHGITSRLSIEPKLDTISAARTRWKSEMVMDGVAFLVQTGQANDGPPNASVTLRPSRRTDTLTCQTLGLRHARKLKRSGRWRASLARLREAGHPRAHAMPIPT